MLYIRVSEPQQATVGRLQVWFPTPAGVVLSCGLVQIMQNVWGPFRVWGLTRRTATPRHGASNPLVAILLGRVHDSVFLTCTYMSIIMRCRPATSGVSPFVPALILGLSFKEDTCIVSPPSLLRVLKRLVHSWEVGTKTHSLNLMSIFCRV